MTVDIRRSRKFAPFVRPQRKRNLCCGDFSPITTPQREAQIRETGNRTYLTWLPVAGGGRRVRQLPQARQNIVNKHWIRE